MIKKIYSNLEILENFFLLGLLYLLSGCVHFKDSNFKKNKMCFIPEGNFVMGDNLNENKPGSFKDSVYVKSFLIDRYEVTYLDYEKCVRAGVCKPPVDTIGWYKVYKKKEFERRYGKYPISFITWGQANIFCAWLKKRLPNEAEWEKAARGNDGRNYPWGYENPGYIANASKKAQFNYPTIVQELSDDLTIGPAIARNSTGTSAVGAHLQGASPYGVHDMAGNVWEWINDSLRNEFNSKYEMIIKGGSFTNLSFTLQSFIKRSFPRNNVMQNIGFRCACDIK